MQDTTGFLGFMIKKGQIGDQIQDHNIGAERRHPEASRGGICDENGNLSF
jgi:hypothetical protein